MALICFPPPPPLCGPGRGRIVRRPRAIRAMVFAARVCAKHAAGADCPLSPRERVRVRGNEGSTSTECRISTGLIIMAKPVIWTVDDDPDVLRAVERDLRRHYGDRYRIISADSGMSALEAVKQLKLRNEAVALFLVDQRMPRMSGVEFLEKAIDLYPEAKRALLT